MSGLKRKPPVKKGLPRKALKVAPKPKQTKKRVPLEKKNAQQLTKEADKWFSRYIRLRDSKYVDGQWIADCITHDRQLVVMEDGKWKKNAQNGHFLSRGFHIIRYNDFNCHTQCSHCNAWLDKKDMTERYTAAVSRLYGEDTVAELVALSKQENAQKYLTKPELLQIIHDSKEYIKHCMENPEHYA